MNHSSLSAAVIHSVRWGCIYSQASRLFCLFWQANKGCKAHLHLHNLCIHYLSWEWTLWPEVGWLSEMIPSYMFQRTGTQWRPPWSLHGFYLAPFVSVAVRLRRAQIEDATFITQPNLFTSIHIHCCRQTQTQTQTRTFTHTHTHTHSLCS